MFRKYFICHHFKNVLHIIPTKFPHVFNKYCGFPKKNLKGQKTIFLSVFRSYPCVDT